MHGFYLPVVERFGTRFERFGATMRICGDGGVQKKHYVESLLIVTFAIMITVIFYEPLW